MKKTMILLAVLTLMGSSVVLADHPRCEKSIEQQEKYIERKMEKMTKDFDLTELQQEEVEKILRDKMDSKYAAKQRLKDEKKKIHEAFKNKMNSVLSAEQKPAFDKMVAKYESKKHKKKKRFLFF